MCYNTSLCKFICTQTRLALTCKNLSCPAPEPLQPSVRQEVALPPRVSLTSGWLSDETEGSRSSMARTAPGWMATMSDEDEEDAGCEGLVRWSFRSVRALTGAGGPDVP